jgi:hypothetical protein
VADTVIRMLNTYPVSERGQQWQGYELEINGFTVRREEWFGFQAEDTRTYLPGPAPRDVDLDTMFGPGTADAVRDLIDNYQSWLAQELLTARIAELVEAAQAKALGRIDVVRIA